MNLSGGGAQYAIRVCVGRICCGATNVGLCPRTSSNLVMILHVPIVCIRALFNSLFKFFAPF